MPFTSNAASQGFEKEPFTPNVYFVQKVTAVILVCGSAYYDNTGSF